MSRPIQEIEREVLVTYFEDHWNRTQLATFPGAPTVPDPGHGHDELSPVVFFEHPFHAASDDDLAALSSFAVQELRGYDLYQLTMLDGPWGGQTLGLTSEDGLVWVLATPGGDEVVVPGADLVDGDTVSFTSGPGPFNATVASDWLHGAGFVVLNIFEIGPGGPNNRGYFDTGRIATWEARVRFSVIIASPPASSPRLAEQYAGAAFTILTGVDFIRDAAALEGTLERDMADANLISIRQLGSLDPGMARANHIGEMRGWHWYLFQIIFRRAYRITRAGRRPITP